MARASVDPRPTLCGRRVQGVIGLGRDAMPALVWAAAARAAAPRQTVHRVRVATIAAFMAELRRATVMSP
jgi:hypothetical protein